MGLGPKSRFLLSLTFWLPNGKPLKSRGALDFRGSSDFEDIVYVLENAENIKEELINSPLQVKSYLKQEFGEWLNRYEFEEGLYCHVERGSKSDKVPNIIAILHQVFMS